MARSCYLGHKADMTAAAADVRFPEQGEHGGRTCRLPLLDPKRTVRLSSVPSLNSRCCRWVSERIEACHIG
jgi:hypothetical protein